jgi:hypothetical protein
MDLDVVIGTRGPIAPPEPCKGLMVPIVAFDQIYSFDPDALIKQIPRPEKFPEEEFAPAAADLILKRWGCSSGSVPELTQLLSGLNEFKQITFVRVHSLL